MPRWLGRFTTVPHTYKSRLTRLHAAPLQQIVMASPIALDVLLLYFVFVSTTVQNRAEMSRPPLCLVARDLCLIDPL